MQQAGYEFEHFQQFQQFEQFKLFDLISTPHAFPFLWLHKWRQ